MKESTRKLWVDRIKRWQASGLDAETFAYNEGISPKTLWNKKYAVARACKAMVPSAAQFVEIVQSRAAEREAVAPFEVTLASGSRVVVPARFDRAALQSLVDVLRGER